MSYISLKSQGESLLIEKKSRFKGYAVPVDSEEEALMMLEEISNENPGHSALAYGYIIGTNLQRFSDGGEPSGTAGMPILSVMQKKGMTKSLVAVVRWFGGIKLGAGGLARAFSSCGSDAIDNAGLAEYVETQEFSISIDYSDLGKVENRLQNESFERLDTEFADNVVLKMRAKLSLEERLRTLFADWTMGKAEVKKTGDVYFYPWDKE